ncbi:hypothetical protein BUALT_Bualt14G0081800 [Buddleja alternifolia]|uniref:AB hydrolase-1 domain-containing protein n=1 Tax=Buddleja alternifolia TaxID=168488 RepID=A0AAV6WH76_9LAMI|nr:hypothetical protein BUALT_Bualt14G0081800 [Buddleja alternifolia]
MEKIEHKYVQVNGLKLHVAEAGSASSPAVVFLHGFPEIWYCWRHQLTAVGGKAGFRAIAIDYRGYGLSDQPPQPEKTTFSEFVSDLLALLHALSIPKDFGARVAYLFALHHPEKVLGIITLVVPYLPPRPLTFHESLPEGNEIPIAKENQEMMDMVDPSTSLPPWFTDEDLAVYASLYDKSGFRTALTVPYRSMPEDFNITNVKVEAPALYMIGEKEYFFKFRGMEEYIKGEKAKMFVPKKTLL